MNRYSSLATLALLVSVLPFAACEELAAPELVSDTASATAEAPDSYSAWIDKVSLTYGSATTLRGGRRLAFDALGRDSRCPIGVDCVHAGEVEAHFTLVTRHGAFPIKLVLPGGNPKALPLHEAPWASVDGLLVYLVRLDPYPMVPEGAVGRQSDSDVLSPMATLVVKPCPGTAERCASGGGGGSTDA